MGNPSPARATGPSLTSQYTTGLALGLWVAPHVTCFVKEHLLVAHRCFQPGGGVDSGGPRAGQMRLESHRRPCSSEGNLARSPGRGRAIMCFCSMALGSRHVVHVQLQAWAPFVSSTTPIQHSNVRRQFAPAQPQAPPAPHYFCLRHTTQNTRRSHNERSPQAYASTQINRSRTDENHPRTRTAAQQTRREPPK